MTRQLNDWLTTYLDYTSYLEAPAMFRFWGAISTISSALRRKTWYDMGFFHYSPNFYIILVAPSGIATKSTAMRSARRFLDDIPDITVGPNALTWESLLPAFAEAAIERPNGSGEFVAESCLTFAASELGSLLKVSSFDLMITLTDLWDGEEKEWKKRTLYRGVETVEHPWITLIAGTTPRWIADHMGAAFVETGFTSRCVFVFSDKKERFVENPKEELEKQGPAWEAQGLALAEDIKAISLLAGEYKRTPEARELGRAWYETMNTDPKLRATLGEFGGYLSRRQGHLYKLAMCLTASRTDELLISRDDLEKAIFILEEVEQDMMKVLGSVDQSKNSRYYAAIMSLFGVETEIPLFALSSVLLKRFGITKSEIMELINSMELAGMLEGVTKNGALYVKKKQNQ